MVQQKQYIRNEECVSRLLNWKYINGNSKEPIKDKKTKTLLKIK